MARNVVFEDNSRVVIEALEDKAIAWLHEAKDSVAGQASRNSPVKTTALKQSFQNDSMVDENKLEAYVGSTVEWAIYQELGTGEYALEGNGRTGGWVYKDPYTGKLVFTKGNRPQRMLHSAYVRKKGAIKQRAEDIFKG